MAKEPVLDADDFSLLQRWRRRSSATTCAETGGVVPDTELPRLGLITRLYDVIESTSYQAERNFSALALLVGNLPKTKLPLKVEKMILLVLNETPSLRFVTTYKAVDARAAKAAKASNEAAAVLENAAGHEVAVVI